MFSLSPVVDIVHLIKYEPEKFIEGREANHYPDFSFDKNICQLNCDEFECLEIFRKFSPGVVAKTVEK